MLKIQDMKKFSISQGYESRTPTFREDHKLQMFENIVLRKISEPKNDETSSSGYCVFRNLIVFTVQLCQNSEI
jgi:hypothetical protein